MKLVSGKTTVVTILIVCSFILMYDAYIFSTKKTVKADTNVLREQTGTDSGLFRSGERFYPPQINPNPFITVNACKWTIKKSTITTATNPGPCAGADLDYTFAAACSAGTSSYGCPKLYIHYVYTILNSDCTESVWSSGFCDLFYDGVNCGIDPNFTADTCFSIPNSIVGPPWGYGVMRVYVFQTNDCSNLSNAMHVETAYTNVTGNPITGATYNIIADPCP